MFSVVNRFSRLCSYVYFDILSLNFFRDISIYYPGIIGNKYIFQTLFLCDIVLFQPVFV